jgi:hypothetical protein
LSASLLYAANGRFEAIILMLSTPGHGRLQSAEIAISG